MRILKVILTLFVLNSFLLGLAGCSAGADEYGVITDTSSPPRLSGSR